MHGYPPPSQDGLPELECRRPQPEGPPGSVMCRSARRSALRPPDALLRNTRTAWELLGPYTQTGTQSCSGPRG